MRLVHSSKVLYITKEKELPVFQPTVYPPYTTYKFAFCLDLKYIDNFVGLHNKWMQELFLQKQIN